MCTSMRMLRCWLWHILHLTRDYFSVVAHVCATATRSDGHSVVQQAGWLAGWLVCWPHICMIHAHCSSRHNNEYVFQLLSVAFANGKRFNCQSRMQSATNDEIAVNVQIAISIDIALPTLHNSNKNEEILHQVVRPFRQRNCRPEYLHYYLLCTHAQYKVWNKCELKIKANMYKELYLYTYVYVQSLLR